MDSKSILVLRELNRDINWHCSVCGKGGVHRELGIGRNNSTECSIMCDECLKELRDRIDGWLK